MNYSLYYFDEARQDVNEAKAWYQEKNLGLEKRFPNAVKEAIITLQTRPLAYSIRYKNIRIARTKTFPYGIHFYVDDVQNRIVIIAILQNKRNPETWTERY